MSKLLTYEEYTSLGASLDFPQSPFIDGKYYKGSGELMTTINPSTGMEITSITTASDEDVDNDNYFVAKMGGEAILKLLSNLDVVAEINSLLQVAFQHCIYTSKNK